MYVGRREGKLLAFKWDLLCKHARHKKVEIDIPLDVKKRD
jgi:hypothetical protein